MNAAINPETEMAVELRLTRAERDTYRDAAERWKWRAMSAERVWAVTAHTIGLLRPGGQLRADDSAGLITLCEAHARVIQTNWMPDPDAPAERRRVTDEWETTK